MEGTCHFVKVFFPPAFEFIILSSLLCSVNCVYSSWSEWCPCSQTCIPRFLLLCDNICKEDFYQDKKTNPPRRSVHRFLPEAEQVRDDPNLMRIMADVSPFQTKNILKEEYQQRWGLDQILMDRQLFLENDYEEIRLPESCSFMCTLCDCQH